MKEIKPKEIKFSRASKKDIPGIVQVMNNTYYTSFAYKNKSEEEIITEIASHFDKKNYLICYELTGFNTKKIIGYSIFAPASNYLKNAPLKINKNYAYSLGIGISEDYRNQGLGLKLKEYTEKIIKEENFEGVYTDVSSKNIKSIKLQKKLGFNRLIEYIPSNNSEIKKIIFSKELK